MQQQLERKLRAVRSRLRVAGALRQMVLALSLGCGLALILGVLRLGTGGLLPLWSVWVVLAAAPAIGIGRAWMQKISLSQAARAVDERYGWQDSLTTAWSIIGNPVSTPLQRLQLQLSAELCDRIVPSQVVAVPVPAGSLRALVLLAAAIGLGFCPTAWPKKWEFAAAQSAEAESVAETQKQRLAPPVSPQLAESSLRAWQPSIPPAVPRDGRLASLADRDIVRSYFLAIQPRAEQRAP